MQEFILKYWKLIAAALLFIVSSAISTIVIVKKSGGKVSVWDALKAVVLEKIPSYVAIVETSGHGEEKKTQVLNLALKDATSALGRDLTEEETSAIIALASKQIEAVLSAPQKKEAVEVKQKKSKYRI